VNPVRRPGLPDGFFSDQKFGHILEDLGIENVAKYSCRLEYFTTLGYILWAFGNFVVISIFFPALVNCTKKKSGNPAVDVSA
jgi:hypothetical protein